jgi:hypothetical protein
MSSPKRWMGFLGKPILKASGREAPLSAKLLCVSRPFRGSVHIPDKSAEDPSEGHPQQIGGHQGTRELRNFPERHGSCQNRQPQDANLGKCQAGAPKAEE